VKTYESTSGALTNDEILLLRRFKNGAATIEDVLRLAGGSLSDALIDLANARDELKQACDARDKALAVLKAVTSATVPVSGTFAVFPCRCSCNSVFFFFFFVNQCRRHSLMTPSIRYWRPLSSQISRQNQPIHCGEKLFGSNVQCNSFFLKKRWKLGEKYLNNNSKLWAAQQHPHALIGLTGSGKTRTLYEMLCESFGFLWICDTNRNGGTSALQSAIDRWIENSSLRRMLR
jgi:hypothetical protein